MPPDVSKCTILPAEMPLLLKEDLINRDGMGGPHDEPADIIDGAIEAQRKLLCGYLGNERADKIKVMESQDPTNAAISLAGELML